MVALGMLIVPTVLFAQSGDGDVSRSSEGRILHRRSPEPGDAPVADTTVYVYAPGDSERNLPVDLVRDGESMPRPSTSTEPRDNEPIHTPQGLERPTAPGLNTLPSPTTDPSAPLPPTPDLDVQGDGIGSIDDDAEISNESPAGDSSAFDPDATTPSTNPDPNADPIEPAVEDPRSGLGDEAAPDRDTEREGTLHYNEVFDPSVVPFKRNRSLDVVGEDLVLRVSDGRMERLEPRGNRVERGREVFWGSVLLSGQAGERIPIPSVSPEGNILSYQANPPQDVRFERDAAGNFYATPELDGRLRLVFVTDAPAHWFGRSLPVGARFDQVPRNLRPKVPRSVQREAIEVAAAMGIAEGMSYSTMLEKLVVWFREFEPGEPPPTQGSVYRDIALGKKGICRHRGHGFVITAQALGIPAHYVFNEAHVFVEVYIPSEADAGWLRIDLGGGAEELQVHNGEGKTLHQGGPDLMNAPAPFDEARDAAYTAGAERVTGLLRDVEGSPGRAGAGSGPREAQPRPGAMVPLAGRPAERGCARRWRRASARASTTPIALSESLVYRGDAVRITGQVTTTRGAPIASGTVQLLLTHGPEREAVALLGSEPRCALGSSRLTSPSRHAKHQATTRSSPSTWATAYTVFVVRRRLRGGASDGCHAATLRVLTGLVENEYHVRVPSPPRVPQCARRSRQTKQRTGAGHMIVCV